MRITELISGSTRRKVNSLWEIREAVADIHTIELANNMDHKIINEVVTKDQLYEHTHEKFGRSTPRLGNAKGKGKIRFKHGNV